MKGEQKTPEYKARSKAPLTQPIMIALRINIYFKLINKKVNRVLSQSNFAV
jgi:hypothetical protein